MPKYLIAFNDEWVPAHTPEQLQSKSEASSALLEEMKEAGVFLYADGGIDASTAVFSVVSKDGKAGLHRWAVRRVQGAPRRVHRRGGRRR